MQTRPREWNRYEAVVLLDGLLKIEQNKITRDEAVKQVSSDLRKMALNQGEVIDDTFRNENGIYFQLQSMESAFKGYTIYKPASKLFIETVDIYKNDKKQYYKLLDKAEKMIEEDSGDSLRDEFTKYLSSKKSGNRVKEILLYCDDLEEQCLMTNLLTKPLFQTEDLVVLDAVQKAIWQKNFNKFDNNRRKAMYGAAHYYYTFVKDRNKTNTEIINESSLSEITKEENQSSMAENSIAITRTDDDKRLLNKYPVIYKRLFNALKESIAGGITINDLYEKTGHIARIAEIKTILDYASWVDGDGKKYWFSQDIVSHSGEESDETKNIIVENEDNSDDIDKGVLAGKVQYHNDRYEKILNANFKNGFRMNSPIELRRFRKYFENEFKVKPQESDVDITSTIKKLCILINDRAYLLEIVINEGLKQQIFDYIDQSFENGIIIIYYQAICSEFDDELLYSPIYNDVNALKEYLSKTGDGRFYIHDNFISKTITVRVDLLTEIRSCMQAVDRPVGYDELCSMLSHLSKDVIKSILDNDGEFIENGPNEYFDVYCLHISDTEIEDIANLIERSIEDKGFLGGNELYDIVQSKYPDIIDNNPNLSVYGFRDALKYKLGGRFTFKGNIISKAGVDLSMSEVFAEFARTHDSFTVDELQVLADDLATQIYFPSVYEYSLRVSQNQFVSKKNIQFPIDEVDYAIDQFCVGNYMAIQDVHNFGAFPYVGFPWNNFMLEHYVADYSKDFKLVDNGFSKTTCVGAIVKRSACIGSFDDLLVDVLVNSNIELNREAALDYLKDRGYLARRIYSNINDIIIRAKALRNWKEAD